MQAWVLIVWLLSADGPREVRVEFQGNGRMCEAAARDIRIGTVPPPRGATVIDAFCRREYET